MLSLYANGKWVRKQETSYKKYIHIQYLNSLFVCKIEPFYPSQFTLHTSIYAQTRTSFVPFPVGCRDRCCLLYCNHGICPHSLTNVPWYSRRIYSVVSSSSCTHSLFICSYIVFLSSWTHCLIQTGNEWENGKPVTKYCIIIHVFFYLLLGERLARRSSTHLALYGPGIFQNIDFIGGFVFLSSFILQ